MAFARDVYTATGGQTDFTITFNYLDQQTDIKVYQNGSLLTLTTNYTFPNSTTVRLVIAASNGDTVVIQRATSQSTRLVDYTTGTLTEADLDTDSIQAFYMSQEAVDIANTALVRDGSNLWGAAGVRITNVGAPTAATDAVTKSYADGLAIAAGNVVAPVNPDEDGYVLTASGGTWSWADHTQITSTDTTAAAGPIYTLYRNSASPAVSDLIGEIKWDGEDSADAQKTYAKLQGYINDPTAGSEDGGINFYGMVAGTLTRIFYTASGMVLGAATGGDAGAGTVNAGGGLYDDGTRVRAIGLDTIWVPAGAMTPRTTNGAASGLSETTTNKIMLRTLDFDQTTKEYAQFSVVMPKSWDKGTITAEFVWKADSSSGDVVWGISGVAISDDGVADSAFGTEVTLVDTMTATTDIMKSTASSAVTIAGTPANDDLVILQVSRAAASGSDTLAADARLIGVKILFTRDAKNDA